jgi:hypothetical protein
MTTVILITVLESGVEYHGDLDFFSFQQVLHRVIMYTTT